MKNLYLIPTDKPSRLLKTMPKGNLILSKSITSGSHWENQNIYITNDEEIKEGDWTLMFDDLGNLFLCDKPQQYLGIEKGHHLNKGLRKIILTTDQDLINDDVQAIDDDFLEWFVRNPSCEKVDVKYKYWKEINDIGKYTYKIIIPKEKPKPFKQMEKLTEVEWEQLKKSPFHSKKEPKPESSNLDNDKYKDYSVAKERAKNYMSLKGALDSQYVDFSNSNADKITSTSTTTIKEEPKQETLEEVAENKFGLVDPILGKSDYRMGYESGLIAGAKWQSERMYS